MLFNSLTFAIFFPTVFVLYWTLPHKFRWIVLRLTSYYFYMSWNVKWALLSIPETTSENEIKFQRVNPPRKMPNMNRASF